MTNLIEILLDNSIAFTKPASEDKPNQIMLTPQQAVNEMVDYQRKFKENSKQDKIHHKKEEEDRNRILHNQNININPRSREVVIDGILVSLTYTEFQILHLLMSHPGWVFTRYQIIDKVRGENYPVTDRSIDFQIVGLRKKMMGKGNLIETIRGVGYRFQHHET